MNPLIDRDVLPDFSKMTPEHFMPAFEAAEKEARRKLAQIKSCKDAASFSNTVVPLERLFEEVSDTMYILGQINRNAYTKEYSALQKEIGKKVAALKNEVFQDPELGARFRAVYSAQDASLDEDDKTILKLLFQAFEKSGALLSEDKQKRIREIDGLLVDAAQRFKDNLQGAPDQQAVLITDPAELEGLPSELVEGMAADAKKKGKTGWLFTPERLLVDELLECAAHTAFRKKIFVALENMGKVPPLDNRAVIAEMQKLRHEYATILGYDHYAQFMRSRMMLDLDEAQAQLKSVQEKALPKFEEDMRALEKFAGENGGPAKLEPWDVPYWAARQCKALYDFDSNAFARYLQIDNVLESMFSEAGELFGVTFSENTSYSKVHDDVRTFDVFSKGTGELVGVLHIDSYARPGQKTGGAWMCQIQAKAEGHPNVIGLNMNIAKPAGKGQALVGLSQYITFFHEMGHSLHGLLGTNVKYRSLFGTNASPSDYVEIHSMINEQRALLRRNLEKHAISVDDGKPVPGDLLDKLLEWQEHFATAQTLRLVQNSLRDLAFHSMNPDDYTDDEALQEAVKMDSPYADHLRPYSLTRFTHLFDSAHSGYAAGYVNYLIAHIHAVDGFEPFEKDPYGAEDVIKRLAHFYSRGSAGVLKDNYRQCRGRDATADALMREIGVNDNVQGKPAVKTAKKPPAV